MNKTKAHRKKKSSVTRQDVAKSAGVSTAVVSYVINNGPRPVAEDTRKRVLQAIKQLGYRPNKHAQRLKSETKPAEGKLGIVIGSRMEMVKRPHYADILYSLYHEASRQGQRVRFMHFFEELHDPLLFNEHVHPEEISALILLVSEPALVGKNHALLRRIIERINNVVCLGQPVANVPAVVFDRVEAARKAVSHLIHLKHRRIGFAGNCDERVMGYRQTLLDHELVYDEELVLKVKNAPEGGYQGALSYLKLADPPGAIVAASDETAIGMLHAFHERGVKVPGDVALVSIDDIDLAAFVHPTLTTVRIPRHEMGIHALRMLAMQAAYPDTPPASMVVPTELIIRQSCGAKKAEGVKA